jgi:hypothetical protein
MTILGLVNAQTLICENVTIDERPASEVQIDGYIVIDITTTSVITWNWNGIDWIEVDSIGDGGIGYSYENGKLVLPKPVNPPTA